MPNRHPDDELDTYAWMDRIVRAMTSDAETRAALIAAGFREDDHDANGLTEAEVDR